MLIVTFGLFSSTMAILISHKTRPLVAISVVAEVYELGILHEHNEKTWREQVLQQVC